MKYLVSACLIGDNCKYNGGNNKNTKVIEFLKDKEYIKVCPEVLGGLNTPRIPSEINGNKVINKEGIDVTDYFLKGAYKVLEIAKNNHCTHAIFKSKSPSCGNNLIYNGEFNNTLINGDGITTKILKENGIVVINCDDL